jgi:cobyrinic acid a,c-diamide synthase
VVTVLPRVVIAAPGSAHGKTTVATGLMAALRGADLEVSGFKVGPDYIDPGYHALATGRPGRNLDPHLCRPDQLVPLLLHGASTPRPADVAVIEGVMGLFDGQIGGDGFASTAHVATLLDAPVIVVLDISQVSRTTAAIVHGLNTFDPAIRLSGVILNKAGSARHAAEVTSAMEATGIEVLGVLPRDAGIEAPSRHLGLIPAAEREDAAESIRRLAAQIRDHVSVTKIMRVAHTARPLDTPAWAPGDSVGPASKARPVVAVAGGRAFTFRYPETDELLTAAGCEPVVFDPLTDTELPPGTTGIYLGGGFPEVHAAELAANASLRSALRAAIAAGAPTVAECAGLLYLCRTVDDRPMAGAISADGRMTQRLTLRYRSLLADHDHLLAREGARVTGHEFHRTAVQPLRGDDAAWLVDGEPAGFSADPAGVGRPSLHASYIHVHWAGHPSVAQRFADAVHAHAARPAHAAPTAHTTSVARQAASAAPQHLRVPEPSKGCLATGDVVEPDLRHHGDQDLREGLIDLAVNVRLSQPPDCLIEIINETTAQLAAYPRPDEAIAAIASGHGLRENQVLPTAGGAEAFTLIARATQPRHPVVIHPQFTEPEAALIAAGHRPVRVMTRPEDGFRFHPASVPRDADLVVIGNPTNPTSVLHPATAIRSLLRPGRVVVVDEAFMDAVPQEAESMIGGDLAGLVVVRSLTKTWGLAGLRTGYALGDPDVLAAMRGQQPPWSVSTPALAVITACLSPEARAMAAEAATQIANDRTILLELLAGLDLSVGGNAAAPFALIDTRPMCGQHPPGWARGELREAGFAVRRGDTFPGLGPDWIRVAVRAPSVSRAFAEALRRLDCRSARM